MAMFSFGHDMQVASRLLHGVDFALVPLSACGTGADSRDDDMPGAPGWYDSSWALQQGLDVREDASAGTLPREWGELFLYA